VYCWPGCHSSRFHPHPLYRRLVDVRACKLRWPIAVWQTKQHTGARVELWNVLLTCVNILQKFSWVNDHLCVRVCVCPCVCVCVRLKPIFKVPWGCHRVRFVCRSMRHVNRNILLKGCKENTCRLPLARINVSYINQINLWKPSHPSLAQLARWRGSIRLALGRWLHSL
jgi:hypothetical protein